MKWFDYTALTLVIIGAVNWLLVGIFRFDLVAFLFGNLSWISRIVYPCSKSSLLMRSPVSSGWIDKYMGSILCASMIQNQVP